jgi:hypothetical protein
MGNSPTKPLKYSDLIKNDILIENIKKGDFESFKKMIEEGANINSGLKKLTKS